MKTAGRWMVALACGSAALAASAPVASARTTVTCRSGGTIFQRAGVRVFVVSRVYGNPHTEGSHYKAFYVCAHDTRRPESIWGEPFSREAHLRDFEIAGDRLGFVASSAGVSSGAGTAIGWVQLPNGPVRERAIWVDEEVSAEEETGPKIPSERLRYAIAEDGSIALAGEAIDYQAQGEHPHQQPPPQEWEIALVTYDGRRLSAPRALLKTAAAAEAPLLSSIAIDGSDVSWQTLGGAAVNVPR